MADYTDQTTVDVAVHIDVRDPDPLASGDVVPPVVTLVDPVAGSTIKQTSAIVVDITDNVGIRLSVVTAQLGELHEVVWLLDCFAPWYSLSTRDVITDGYRYTIRRRGGWPASPTIRVEAVDRGGNEAP